MAGDTATRADGFETVLSWLDHEQRLLEILAYRIDGLTNMLRAQQHRMICQSASDVEDVKDQLANAAVQRDLAVLDLTERRHRPTLMTLSELRTGAPEAQQAAAESVKKRIAQAAADLEAAQERCRIAAAAYRPTTG